MDTQIGLQTSIQLVDYTGDSAMRRKPMSGRHHARKFNRARRKTRAINNPRQIMRGGFRL